MASILSGAGYVHDYVPSYYERLFAQTSYSTASGFQRIYSVVSQFTLIFAGLLLMGRCMESLSLLFFGLFTLVVQNINEKVVVFNSLGKRKYG